ncbi:MAG: hypothetical protein H7338_18500 [Candidatus Sericytochromatia bacterium]|nr:hypothetical protein [Candidatus Sericytochromatia bacterium]
MTEKVLVTAAYRGELDQLGALPSGWVAQPCGIGGVAAAAGLAMLMTVHAPTRIIVLGTCGALGRGLSIGSLIAPKLVRWCDPGVLNGTAHMPPSVYKALQVTPWPGLPMAICLQTPSITLAADHATRLATMSEGGFPAVEHLELYSMAFVAHTFGLPISAILGVTNSVGPTGHRDWVANHREVEALVQAALFRNDKQARIVTPVTIQPGPSFTAKAAIAAAAATAPDSVPLPPQPATAKSGTPAGGVPPKRANGTSSKPANGGPQLAPDERPPSPTIGAPPKPPHGSPPPSGGSPGMPTRNRWLADGD